MRLPLIPTVIAFVVCVVLAVVVTRALVLGSVRGDAASAGATREQATETSTSASSTADKDDDSSSGTTSSDTKDADASATSSKQENDADDEGASSSDGVEDPWVVSGYYTSGDATLDEEVKTFCDDKADTSMDLDDAAVEVYKGVAWSEYVERDDAQHPAGKDWRIEYARKYYEHDCSGNCYEFAAFLSYCLQYLGFSDAHAEGVLIELESGGWGDHGLVYVTNTDGVASLCDTSLGLNGWMLKESAYNVQFQDFENA